MRVVSLLASSTEIVHALGAGSYLVGRSHECDYPPRVTDLPSVTAPKLATDGRSYEIDERIKAIVQEGLSVYHVDAPQLESLRPDLLITQVQCEVCAVSERDVMNALRTYTGHPPQVVSLRPNSLADVWRDIQTIADALGLDDRGHVLVATMQRRMSQIARMTRSLPSKPTVACIEWIDPLMAAGNWMPELVEMAGGVNLFGTAGEHSPHLSWDQLLAANPDVIFISPCGYDLATTSREVKALTSRPGWDDLWAVLRRRVILADGNQYFHRPGPRLVDSLELLVEALHPEAVRRHGSADTWQRCSR